MHSFRRMDKRVPSPKPRALDKPHKTFFYDEFAVKRPLWLATRFNLIAAASLAPAFAHLLSSLLSSTWLATLEHGLVHGICCRFSAALHQAQPACLLVACLPVLTCSRHKALPPGAGRRFGHPAVTNSMWISRIQCEINSLSPRSRVEHAVWWDVALAMLEPHLVQKRGLRVITGRHGLLRFNKQSEGSQNTEGRFAELDC